MLYDTAVEQFLEYLELEQNRSAKTIANYSHYLTRLSDFAVFMAMSKARFTPKQAPAVSARLTIIETSRGGRVGT